LAEQDGTHPISSPAVQGFSLHKIASCDVQCYVIHVFGKDPVDQLISSAT
jgi:hypothetical protein